MRLKHEAGDPNNFNDVLTSVLASFASILYTGTGDNENPTLGELRGKILILRDYGLSEGPSQYGIPYVGAHFQDNFSLGSRLDLAIKWQDARNQFLQVDASTAQHVSGNFLSAFSFNFGFPYFWASGHSSNGTNAGRLATGLTRGVIDTCSAESRCIPEFPQRQLLSGYLLGRL